MKSELIGKMYYVWEQMLAVIRRDLHYDEIDVVSVDEFMKYVRCHCPEYCPDGNDDYCYRRFFLNLKGMIEDDYIALRMVRNPNYEVTLIEIFEVMGKFFPEIVIELHPPQVEEMDESLIYGIEYLDMS